MKMSMHFSERISDEEQKTVERLVRLGLTRFVSQIQSVRVSICDQNGPRGGDDKRCVLRVNLQGLPEIVIQEVSNTLEQAVGLSVDRASRNIARALDRRHRNREYQRRRFTNEMANG